MRSASAALRGLADFPRQSGNVASVRAARSVDPERRINAGEIEGVACLGRQLFEINHLRASVSFTERMHVVHVPDDPRGLLGEFLAGEVFQEICADQPLVNVRHTGFDVSAKLELVTALVQFDSTNLAGLGVDILKQVPVDRAQMRQVEFAGRRSFGKALRHQHAFGPIEFGAVANSKIVLEDGRAGIDVRIVAHSAASAAGVLSRARM